MNVLAASVAQNDASHSITHPLRPRALAGGLSVLLFLLSAFVLRTQIAPQANAWIIEALSIYTGCIVIAWIAAAVVLYVRPPNTTISVQIWRRYANALIWSLHLSVVGLIWGILPVLPLNQVYFAMVFMMAYVPAQVISSPESTVANRGGIILVLGSSAALLATRGETSTTLLALYVFCFGILMFVLSARVQRTVSETVAARLASDKSARELDRLVAIVAAERDAKTRFIAAASHDLGQPLQAASLFFDQMLRTDDREARIRAAEGVKRAFASADALLAHMLGHLQLEADAVVPYPSAVKLPSLLAKVVAQHQPAAERAGLRIAARSVARLRILTDSKLLERALGNLIGNAIAHSRGSRVLVAARHHGPDAVRLWVIDDGIGIARGDVRHVFDDYFQGPAPAGDVRSGFGLGLPSVRRIAAMLGGSADLDPRWIGGCAFFLELPNRSVPDRRLPRSAS